MNESMQALQAATSELPQNPQRQIVSMERALSGLQVHTAHLLSLTWPWNAAPKQTHRCRWEQARLQVDELWVAFRRLHAGLATLAPGQQDLVQAMKPHVQALVMRAGFAFQLLEESFDCLPASSYSVLIREFHDCAIWLRGLTGAFGDESVPVAGHKGFPTAPAEPLPA